MTQEFFLSLRFLIKINLTLHERERESKMSSALTQKRRNARSVAKRMSEFLTLSPSHEGRYTFPYLKNLKLKKQRNIINREKSCRLFILPFQKN